MEKLTENPKSESGPQKKTEETVDMTQYKKRFEDAVADAQYMMIYASTNCPKEIKRYTIERLINARLRVENKEVISAKDEADFWIAYQEIWKLVKPATAESIKANLPLENTSASKLLGNIPVLSRWLGGGTISRARRTVNRYIVFTVFVLILLLILQIYWVIGNQLTTKLDEQLKAEADLSLQINKNQQEYNALEIRYKQNEIDSGSFKTNGTYTFYSSPDWERDTLENNFTKARLETDLESLKSQLERSSTILRIWSSPWDGFINKRSEEVDPIYNDKYAPQIESIDGQIEAINNQLRYDPDGTIAAEDLNSTLSPQLGIIAVQLSDLYAKNDELSLKEVEIKGLIEEIKNQLNDLAGDPNADESRKSALEVQSKELEAQLIDLEAIAAVNSDQRTRIRDDLSALAGASNADESRKSALEAQLKELEAQLTVLGASKAGIEGQMEEIKNQVSALSGDGNARKSRKDTLEAQLKDLEAQLADLATIKAVNGDQVQRLQSQSNGLTAQLVPPGQIVSQWTQDKERLTNEKKTLERQQLAAANRERSRQAQLAGQFVLVVLQGYVLPLLYGILGAGTSILRILSKQIEKVIYSEGAGIQHLLRISLGALAGIMVGWFSFLLPNESSSFLGSVSPLAIAFLVGYNIDLFFSMMDAALNKVNEMRQQTPPAIEKDDQVVVPQTASDLPSTQETKSEETPASETAG